MRKGLSDSTMGPALALVLALGLIWLALTTVKPLILNAESAAEGCSFMASLISDVSGGALQTCTQ